jgi:hypothetical protein
MSARLRIPNAATSGGQFTIDTGTNDMTNTSLANRWGANPYVYREDTGSYKVTTATLDLANHSRFSINGLSDSGVTYHVILNF